MILPLNYSFWKINSINFHIQLKNFRNYANFINIFFLSKIYILNNYSISRFNWISVYEYSDDISLNFFENNLQNYSNEKKNINLSSQSNRLHDKIILKKKISLLKKKFDIDYVILSRVFSYKNNYNYNKFKDLENFNINNYNFLSTKSIDLNKKLKLFIKTNRFILKSFFNLKFYRNFSISKNIKNFCNSNSLNYIINFENNILNILMKCDFFISKKDCIWFLDKGLISLNSFVNKNPKALIKSGDIINLVVSDYYYIFYKNNFDFLLNNIYKVNLKFWSINKNRFKNLELKDIKENYPSWIDNYKYFKKDIPLNLEVDYISMTIIVLNHNLNFKKLDFYSFKFISFYMSRLYNWKFII